MTDEPHGLHEIAASNRERIRMLEIELSRARERIHSLESELGAVRFLVEQISRLTDDVKGLTDEVKRLARRALERPSQGTISVLAQYLTIIVAVAALVIAVRH